MMLLHAAILLLGAVLDVPQDKKLDTRPESVEAKDLVFSPSGGAVAYVVPVETDAENKHAVVVNGKKGEAFDEIVDLTFSANGTCAYVGKRGEKRFVIMGNQKYGPYDDTLDLVFSPDGARVAFWANVGEKNFVVVDGKAHSLTLTAEEMPAIGIGNLKPVFSPDGKRVAYAAAKGQKMFIAVDSAAVSQEYDGVKDPVFSTDGQAIAYPARREGKWRVVGKGKEGEGYEDIQWLSYGERGPVYLASPGARMFVVVGDRKLEKHPPAGPPVPSPDGSTAAYWAELGGGKFAVVVGEEAGEAFKLQSALGQAMGYERPIFLSDSKTVVYEVTLESGQCFVVTGSQKSEPYELVDDLVVAPDRKSVAYVAAKDGKYFVVAGGKKSGTFERVARPVVAQDGKTVGFYALKGDEIWWKIWSP